MKSHEVRHLITFPEDVESKSVHCPLWCTLSSVVVRCGDIVINKGDGPGSSINNLYAIHSARLVPTKVSRGT